VPLMKLSRMSIDDSKQSSLDDNAIPSSSRTTPNHSKSRENATRKLKVENLFNGVRLAQKLVSSDESLVTYFPNASNDIKDFIQDLEVKEKQSLSKPRYLS
jgi:hypothetical protein